MRQRKKLNLIYFVLVLAGCGTLVGNPKQPAEQDDPPKSTIALPEVDFSIHSHVSLEEADTSLMLVDPIIVKNRTVDIWMFNANRTARALFSLNHFLRRLKNQDKINAAGKHFRKGEFGKTSLEIKTLAEDQEYEFEAIICHEENIVTHTQWNSTGKIRSIFSHKIPSTKDADDKVLTEIILDKSETSKTLTVKRSGSITNNGPIKLAENFVTSLTLTKDFETDSIDYRFVSSWYDSLPTDNTFIPNRYFSANSTPDKSGIVAAWDSICPKIFDETKPQKPNWCFARQLNAIADIPEESIDEKIQRLVAVGIETKDNLKIIEFDESLVCPSE